jgi:dipeptidyl aminopeptidase/acylaminoacyl peptidase
LLAVDCDGAKSVSAGHAAAGTRMLAVAPAHGVGVGLALSPRGEGRLFMIGRGGRLLDRINDGLATLDSPEPVALHRVAPHGGEVDWLLLPPGRDPRDALPLIVMPYPGAEFDATMPRMFGPADFQPMLSPALLAAHGFAVLAPSMPVGDKEPVADIIAALRPAIAAAIATGRIDPARIGVLGHSYGGYTALVMATELPCLRSAVASAADADLLMSYGAFDPRLKVDFKEGLPTTYPFAWAEQGQGRMGGLPWRDPDRYIRNSPFYRLDKVVAPILLLHGDLDPISVMQAERTYAALYRLGKDARLVRFFGDAHVPASPANIRVRWRETFAWLDRTMTQPRTGGSIFDAAGRCTSPSRP